MPDLITAKHAIPPPLNVSFVDHYKIYTKEHSQYICNAKMDLFN